mgnify:FL=1
MSGLLGITGPAGSGKTTVGDMLVSAGWHRVKFAGPLKAMCRAMGMTEDMIEGDLKEAPIDWLGGKTPRYVMQTLGTEWGRDLIDPDLWVRLARREIISHLERGRNVVVDDLRFDNEHKVILDLDGAVLRLEGRGGIGKHRSEQTLPAHIIFENTGTPDNLREFVEFIFLAES